MARRLSPLPPPHKRGCVNSPCKSEVGKIAAGLRTIVNYGRCWRISLAGRGWLKPPPRELRQYELMETFLNLVWLAVTVAAVWLWRFRWSVSRPNPRHSTRMEAVAMVCVLALLFPVISLTDDLHPETAVVDAASGKRNACLIASTAPQVHSVTVSPGTHLAVGMISEGSGEVHLDFTGLVSPFKLHNPNDLTNSSPGRSPPSLL